VESRTEGKTGWRCFDLLTQERYHVPFRVEAGDVVEVWTAEEQWRVARVVSRSSDGTTAVKVRSAHADYCLIGCRADHGYAQVVDRTRVRFVLR